MAFVAQGTLGIKTRRITKDHGEEEKKLRAKARADRERKRLVIQRENVVKQYAFGSDHPGIAELADKLKALTILTYGDEIEAEIKQLNEPLEATQASSAPRLNPLAKVK